MNQLQKDIQKQFGVKQSNYDTPQNKIYNDCKMSIIILENIWNDIVENKLQDSQMVLNWLDKINEMSIRN